MRIFIDCEFNEFKGELISMALCDEDGNEFYECLECETPGDWVSEHVLPVLFRSPISKQEFQRKLGRFLAPYIAIHIVADWPEDIQHFCESLIVGPGKRLDTPPLTMEVIRIDADSEVPHNALADARGIREALL